MADANFKPCINHPDRPAKGRGLCNSCYVQFLYHSSPQTREKADARAKAWRHMNPARASAIKEKSRAKTPKQQQRDYWLRRKYGISIEEYESLLTLQSGRCAICLQEPANGKRLHVDHCHTSGVVRGLLCHQCNWYLGKVDSIPGLLTRLIAYAAQQAVAIA